MVEVKGKWKEYDVIRNYHSKILQGCKMMTSWFLATVIRGKRCKAETISPSNWMMFQYVSLPPTPPSQGTKLVFGQVLSDVAKPIYEYSQYLIDSLFSFKTCQNTLLIIHPLEHKCLGVPLISSFHSILFLSVHLQHQGLRGFQLCEMKTSKYPNASHTTLLKVGREKFLRSTNNSIQCCIRLTCL